MKRWFKYMWCLFIHREAAMSYNKDERKFYCMKCRMDYKR